MTRRKKILSLFRIVLLVTSCLFVGGNEVVHAQNTMLEGLSKRFLRKSKIKKLGKKLYGKDAPPLSDYQIEKGLEVIAYEPSWLLDKGLSKSYHFNLFTGLVIGEYDINPMTGLPRNEDSFYNFKKKNKYKGTDKKVNIIQQARKITPRMKILFSLTYQNDFGIKAYRKKFYKNLLTNQNVQGVVADSLKSLFTQFSDDYKIPVNEMGIVVDFKELQTSQLEDFAETLKLVKEVLADEYLLYLKISPVLGQEPYLTKEIIEYLNDEDIVDLFIIEANGFEKYSSRPGPSSILYSKKNEPSIDSTVNYYLHNGITKDKMLIEFSYAGLAWEKKGEEQFKLKTPSARVTIDDILSLQPRGNTEFPLDYDKDTTYVSYEPMDAYAEQGVKTKFFYDDALTLERKYSYVRDTVSLKGISIYGVGYNSRLKPKYAESRWRKIAENFSKKKSSWGWMVASYLFAFMPIGFLFSVARYWEVRNILAKPRYKKYWNRFLIAFVSISLIALIVMDVIWFLPRDGVSMIIGAIIVGFFVVYMMVRRYLNKVRKYTKYAGLK